MTKSKALGILIELPAVTKVYELDPDRRYALDLGPDCRDEQVTAAAELCADKGIKAIVAGGRVSVTVTLIEEGVTYVVQPENELPEPSLIQISKSLNAFGLRAVVVPKGVMFSIQGEERTDEKDNG